ncbi:MAG: SAM-dependent methyltransferase [Bacteroidia bacterium]|nr:SAM-dependent methyltransferase [Bacteroidia bacterium]
MNDSFTHASSYRDPSGFVFTKNGVLFRQINQSFKENFDFFISSGCYQHLLNKEFLIQHFDEPANLTGSPDYYKTIRPEQIAYISYPYEWCFEMLKDAALRTLRLVKECLPFGVLLKDATPYNIQWHNGKLIFIDTLSFEKYYEDEPWIAYRQFCESFLSPLLLMHYSKNSLQQLLLAYPDGIPLAITKSLLPRRSRFSLHPYLHIHLHASIAARKEPAPKKKIKFSKSKLLNIITSLEKLITGLKLPEQKTTWSDYYDEVNQRNDYLKQKQKIIEQWLSETNDIKTAADLGANEGLFSRLLAEKEIDTIATDFDSIVINRLYKKIKIETRTNILPLIIDLSNPSPSIGVNNKERLSFLQRTGVDMVLALALIHHLAIGKNIPFSMMAEMFAGMTNYLIIEFIPKEDPKVQIMLSHKKDIYKNYTEHEFIKEFELFFSVSAKQEIQGSGRILYLMKKK